MMDYFPPVGDGEGYTGLELLLMSLSGCSGTAISILLQKMNKNVEGLIIHASGVRNEIAPFAFRRIELTFQLISRDALEDDRDGREDVACARSRHCKPERYDRPADDDTGEQGD